MKYIKFVHNIIFPVMRLHDISRHHIFQEAVRTKKPIKINTDRFRTGSIMDIKKINDLYKISIECLDKDEIELWEMLNLNGDV